VLVHGYDTAVVAFPPIDGIPDGFWTYAREDRSRGVRSFLRPEGHVQIKYVERLTGQGLEAEMQVQTSLPKALFGTNAVDLGPDRVMEAVEAVEGLVARVLPGAPLFRACVVRRLDATADVVLASEEHVSFALARLRGLVLRGRRAQVGESGSLVWRRSRGSITRRVYSKYQESREEAALGRLRVEAAAVGQVALKKALGQSSTVTLEGALSSGAADMIVGPWAAKVLSIVEGAEDVQREREVIRVLLGHGYTAGQAVRLYGYLRAAWLIGGWPSLSRLGWMDASTVWRARRDLAAAGVDPDQLDFVFGGDAGVEGVGRVADGRSAGGGEPGGGGAARRHRVTG